MEDLGITPRNVEALLAHIYKNTRRTYLGQRMAYPRNIGKAEHLFTTLKPKAETSAV